MQCLTFSLFNLKHGVECHVTFHVTSGDTLQWILRIRYPARQQNSSPDHGLAHNPGRNESYRHAMNLSHIANYELMRDRAACRAALN